jgi:hypothetical protein
VTIRQGPYPDILDFPIVDTRNLRVWRAFGGYSHSCLQTAGKEYTPSDRDTLPGKVKHG